MKGKVKWFSNQKGFGFVTDENKKDYFVHFSGLVMDGYKTLSENQEVEFETITTTKGLQAINVVPLKKIKK